MAVSILEALQNANFNFSNDRAGFLAVAVAKSQLNNAVTLLEKGYPLETEVEPLLEKFGCVDDVPDYGSQDDGDGEPIPQHLDE